MDGEVSGEGLTVDERRAVSAGVAEFERSAQSWESAHLNGAAGWVVGFGICAILGWESGELASWGTVV